MLSKSFNSSGPWADFSSCTVTKFKAEPPEPDLGGDFRFLFFANNKLNGDPDQQNAAKGLEKLRNDSHIVPVMVGDPVKCKWISDYLVEYYAIYVQPINYPTVPRGTERLRIMPTPMHSDDDIDNLVNALSEMWSLCALNRAVA